MIFLYNILCIPLLVLMFFLFSGFSLVENKPTVEKGNVIYPYEGGRIQCLSEIDASNKIFVLFKSLDENTAVEFIKVEFTKTMPILKVLMSVDAKKADYGSWIDMQEVNIGINPKNVETTSLVGKTVYSSNGITVMSE